MKKYIFCVLYLLIGSVEAQENASNEHLLLEEQIDIVFMSTVTEAEGKVIEKLLRTMSDSSVVWLLFKQTEVKNLGKKLRGVSSTQFLAYVSHRPNLRRYMKNISRSGMKWSNLTRSTIRGLRKEAEDKLLEDLPNYANFIQRDEDQLMEFVRNEQWDKFIKYSVGCIS